MLFETIQSCSRLTSAHSHIYTLRAYDRVLLFCRTRHCLTFFHHYDSGSIFVVSMTVAAQRLCRFATVLSQLPFAHGIMKKPKVEQAVTLDAYVSRSVC